MAEAPPMFQADGGLQLTAIPGATYYNPESISATPGNATGHNDAQAAEATTWCDRMFDAIQTIFLRTPSYQTSKGITRTKGGPKILTFVAGERAKNDLDPCLLEIATKLVDSGILTTCNVPARKQHPGRCCEEDYEMVPHKDGFADQAAILSLGSDTMLEFWEMPVSQAEKDFRNAFAERYSGTDVFTELITKPADQTVWLEPGSVLVSRGDALEGFAHGLRARPEDLYNGGGSGGGGSAGEGASLMMMVQVPTNAAAVSSSALVTRSKQLATGSGLPAAAAAAAEPTDSAAEPTDSVVAVPRRERASVVLWTPYTGHLEAGE